MYKNPGGKIKTIGKVVFIIGIVISAILCISIWVSGGSALSAANRYSYSYNNSNFGAGILVFFIGLIVCGVGVFISYITNLFLVAFGELVENSTIIKDKLLLMDLTRQPAPAEEQTGPKLCPICGAENDRSSFACSQCGSELSGGDPKKAPISPIKSLWTCSICGAENKGGLFCTKCGVKK